MVDRITPATTDEDRARISAALGVDGCLAGGHRALLAMGHRGPFRGWPAAWEKAGAELVADVAPYEQMKLRLLNGAHSSLAYLGYLAGYETVSEAMADAGFRALCAWLDGGGDADASPCRRRPISPLTSGAARSASATRR